jgi:hypothetical protein
VTGTRHHQTRSDLAPDPGPVQRGHAEPESWQRAHSTLWPWMSIAAACIAGFANIVGLADIDRIYGTETSAFIDQAIAQDTVSLAIVCPAIVVLALLARRGSLAAHLAWLGTLAFTVYNYVIYTLSIHVGPLFLPWIAVLSLSLFALIGGSAILDPHAVPARFQHPRTTLAGWFLIIIAALFAALWLRDLIPSIASGEVPAGARELGLPSNPVHVLDLSFYLPAATVAGIQLVRRRPLGYLIGPGMLVFLGLTGLPILLTPFIADARGESPGWPLLAPMATVVIVSLGLATRLLRTARRTTGTPPDRETDPAGTRPVEAS